MFYLRLLATIGAFLLASFHGLAIALFRRDRSSVASDYGATLARFVRAALGLRVEVMGGEKMLASRPCVYLTNHQSSLDVPILAGIYPKDTVIIAKREIRWIPFFGWLYTATGNILIDRSHNASAVQRLMAAEEAIRTKGLSVWIFPEGTRGSGMGELLPFKKGAFYMAVAAQVPLVPIVVSPLRPLFDGQKRFYRPGTVQVRVLDPIPTAGLGDRDVVPLLHSVREQMSAVLGELRTTPRDATQ